MTSLLVSVVLFISGILNPGQEQPSISWVRVNAPGAEITDLGWTTPPEKPKPANTSPKLDPLAMPSASSGEIPNPLRHTRGNDEWILAPPAVRSPGPPPDYDNVTVNVGIKNSSVKDITVVEGEIMFGDKRDASKQFAVKFLSRNEIPHGQNVTLTQKFSYGEAWKQLQNAVHSKSATVNASINHLEYADGSEWRRQE